MKIHTRRPLKILEVSQGASGGVKFPEPEYSTPDPPGQDFEKTVMSNTRPGIFHTRTFLEFLKDSQGASGVEFPGPRLGLTLLSRRKPGGDLGAKVLQGTQCVCFYFRLILGFAMIMMLHDDHHS